MKAPAFDPDAMPDLSPRPARAPRLGRWLFLAFVLLALALAAGLLPRMRQRAIVAAETRELAIPSVITVAPAPGLVAGPLTLSGELKPLVEAAIYARANGYVRRWLVDLGAHVEAGQLLAELDTPEMDRELTQARTALKQSEAARALAESTAKRWHEMLAAKTVSAQEADEKASDLEMKKASADTARGHVQEFEEMTGFAKITAPFAGTITARRLDVGQLVMAGAGLELYRLAQLDKLRVFVRVPQTHARAIALGQQAEVTMTELPGRQFPARVVRTAGALDPASRTLLTELEIDNPDGAILAGGYAQVRLPDAHPDAALTLPSNTLLIRPEGPQVALVAAGHVRLRSITLGRDFGSAVEILTGLTPADRVILNPADALTDGAEVRVAAPPAQP